MYGEYNQVLYDIYTTLEDTNGQIREIIENQQELISGDKIITQNQNEISMNIAVTNLILIMALLYTFIKGCLRC